MKLSPINNIFIIAKNTFRETVRDKILYGTVGLAVIFFLFTIFLGGISLGEEVRIVKSIGLGGMYIFSIVLTLLLGSSLLHKEMDEKTIFFVLSKPVSHRDVVLGKFLGLFGSLFLSLCIMAITYAGVVMVMTNTFTAPEILAIGFNILEVSLLISIVIFFSSFTRPILATFATITLLYIGHSLSLLVTTATKSGGIFESFALAMSFALPNFEKFNIRNDVLYDIVISPGEILLAVLYVLVYSGLLLFLAGTFFKKKDF